MDLQQKLFEIITPYTEDGIELNSHFIDDLGFDSLTVVEFIMQLEDEFNIEISDEEVSKIARVQDSLTLLESKINANI